MSKAAYKILIADEESRIRSRIHMYLDHDGAVVEDAKLGESALIKALERDYDLILLNRTLPDMSGLDICALIKGMKTTPIILMSSKSDEEERILGFEAGADDYVINPFSPRELICRIHAILKRTKKNFRPQQQSTSSDIVLPQLTIEHEARRVLVRGIEVSLTLKEYDLLRYLALNEGKTFTREALLKEVWKCEPSGDLRTVDSHVKRIREKLQPSCEPGSTVIRTIWGVGYRLETGLSWTG
ncbi:response regulator transcription factor [Paenibacillus sp. y28]